MDDEKRRLFLDTLQFLLKERNIALFQLSDAKARRKLVEKQEKLAKEKVHNLRLRLARELECNSDLLTPEEKKDLQDGNTDD